MKTLILAAGRSKRVKPIEDKNFLPFLGKPLLSWQIERLTSHGFNDILIAVGAHNEEKIQVLADEITVENNAVSISLVLQEDLDMGMAGATLAAEPHIQNGEPLMILSSNDVLQESAFESMKQHLETNADSVLLAYEVSSYFPGGYLVTTDSEGKLPRVTGIQEKPGEGNEPSNLINLVLHLHNKPEKLFKALKETSSEKDDLYEVALQKLMDEGEVRALPYSGNWQAIKHPWHILELMEHILSTLADQPQIDPSAQIADTAVIKGQVLIEAGVKVFENAVISGPAYIGKNAVIANNALVRGSMIGAGSVVGFGSEIARSFISEDCWFHTNYVGDTVMDKNVSFGAGAVCANLRLDEGEIAASGRQKLGPIIGPNVRIGVQTSLMPGVRIGGNTFIGSGITIAEDIPSNKFVKAKTELIIKDNRATLNVENRDQMKGKL